MKIKLTTVYVNDQEQALRFYTGTLGLVKKADFTNGPFRWLTVVSPEDPEGTELQLAANGEPAAKAFQAHLYEGNRPAINFFTDDVQADYDRLAATGAEFKLGPTDTPGSKIVQLDDGCGNMVQITQLMSWSS